MSKKSVKFLFVLALLCLAMSLFSSTMAAGTHSLSAAAQSAAVGGNDCTDFAKGAAGALGIGALFGCAWCGVGALVVIVGSAIVC